MSNLGEVSPSSANQDMISVKYNLMGPHGTKIIVSAKVLTSGSSKLVKRCKEESLRLRGLQQGANIMAHEAGEC